MLALLTRRWILAWIALAGNAIASALGMLAGWSRQTAAVGQPGPGIGLIVAWFAVILLTFHWARVVWTRTALHLAAESGTSSTGGRTEAKVPARRSGSAGRAEADGARGAVAPPT